MSTPYIGEIRLVGFSFAPEGWAFCDGSTLSIAENEVLFALLGTTYGGNGVSTFSLPNLTGRVVVHQGTGQSTYVIGQSGGSSTVALTANQMPSHQHAVASQNGAGDAATPAGNFFASTSPPVYATPAAYVSMGSAVGAAGSSQGHDNMQPYIVMNFIISLFGVFPSQN